MSVECCESFARTDVRGETIPDQGWKKPRFFGIFVKVFRFLRFFLGFNVHNAEHRYTTHDK